jgi:CheY-like chemotaxis protein
VKPKIVKNDSDFTGRRILVIEDTPYSLELIKEMLAGTHAVILEASTGKEALTILEKGEKIDLVLADVRLPDLDGFSLIRTIRTVRPNLPVIAQTAYAYELDKQKCLESGASAYLAKPFLKEDLIRTIQLNVGPCSG